jgi:hypothetical protein
MNKITIDKIASQAINEIAFARRYKQGKVSNWQKNEALYYGNKETATESRSNVDLSRMQEFVHTVLSKIDNPLIFEYTKRKSSQLNRVKLLNSLKDCDSSLNNWDIKDIVGKKQAIIYGRAIFSYYADSVNKQYKAHLETIDAYDFLIDPSAGGIDIENARYLGDFSVVLSKKDLKDGVKKGVYNRDVVNNLINSNGNVDETSQEETNKQSRSYGLDTVGKKEIGDPNKFKFWRWFTTYSEDGERYYLLMDNSGQTLLCEKLKDIFSETNEFPNGAWPYWSWASFMDLTEFWTPSFCDYAREIFMAQNVSINQMLDNAEAINKPQRIVNVKAIEDMTKLKYRRDGIIPVKGDFDINRAYQTIVVPSIQTPVDVFNILEGIQQKSSGVTDQVSGVADTDGRATIYEGNQQAVADRFGLLNKSYAFGYKRFAKLYLNGVKDHLISKVSVDMIGPNGVEIVDVSKKNIFYKDDTYGIVVKASNADQMVSSKDKMNKLTFLEAQAGNQLINQKKNIEKQAEIIGFDQDEIKQLLDVNLYGDDSLMSECDRDLERLLNMEDVKANEIANNAYKQKMVDYLKDKKENISMKQFEHIAKYIESLEPVIIKNEARKLEKEKTDMIANGGMPEGMEAMLGGEPVPEELPMNTPGKQKKMNIQPEQFQTNQ